ncbi:MAG: diguanylate cyclase [bacterium]
MIEDDPQDVKLIQIALADAADTIQNSITHVDRIGKALEQLEVKHFDVAILDLALPDSNGITTLKSLLEKAPSLPVVILTGFGDESLGIEAVHIGAQDYLVKGQLDRRMLPRIIKYAIERKQSHEELRKSKDQLKLEKTKLEEILSIEEDLNRIVHLDKLIDFAVNKTTNILEADKGSIMLINGNGRELYIKKHIGLNDKFVSKKNINIKDSTVGFVAEQGVPILVSDIETDSRFSRKNRLSYKSKSFMSAPIKLDNEIFGIINVADKNSSNGDIFSEIDLKVLIMIVRQIAVAVENANLYSKLNYLTITDPLTDIYNSRYFTKSLNHEINRVNRYKGSLCLLLLDIDDFKSYNDTFGHLSGDTLLKKVSKVLKKNLRNIDIPCRYAGDEFVVILPETDICQAKIVAEKIKEKVENLALKTKVTVSIGIANYSKNMNRFDLFQKADTALYEAKKAGKNLVIEA